MPVTIDRVARAIGDPTRLSILDSLRSDELTVAQIADGFAMSRPAVSQHLKVLHDAELVDRRSAGTRNFYMARPAGLRELRGWLDTFWSDALDRLADEAEKEARP